MRDSREEKDVTAKNAQNTKIRSVNGLESARDQLSANAGVGENFQQH
jgi:hypothetical protein